MSDRATDELNPPSPEEIGRLRDELRSLRLEGTGGLDEDAIEEILALPPTLLFEAIRHLSVAFRPLSSILPPEHPK